MNKGFISTLLIIIVGLALLKYFFDWSIFDAAATEQGRGTITYIKNVVDLIWEYLSIPVMFIWEVIFVPLFNLILEARQ